MEISLGFEVVGEAGKLGDISRFIVDAKSDTVDELVVKHGRILSREQVVPMKHVQRVEGKTVYINMNEQEFEATDAYTEASYGAVDADDVVSPGLGREGHPGSKIQWEFSGNMGALPDEATPPGDAGIVPVDERTPVVEAGTRVVDAYGEKVGEVANLSFDVVSMKPTRIHLHRGSLLGHDVDVPGGWVQELAYKAIVLSVPKERVDGLTERPED